MSPIKTGRRKGEQSVNAIRIVYLGVPTHSQLFNLSHRPQLGAPRTLEFRTGRSGFTYQFDAVDKATPLLLTDCGNTSDGNTHPIGP